MYLTGYKVIVVKFITLMICTMLLPLLMLRTIKTTAAITGSTSTSEMPPAAAGIQNLLSSNRNVSHKQSQSCWHNDKRRQFVNSFELQAFKEFLDYNHLKYAIIIYATEQANNCRDHQKRCQDCWDAQPHCQQHQKQQQQHSVLQQNSLNKFLLTQLTGNYHLQFYNLAAHRIASSNNISLIEENHHENYFRNNFKNTFANTLRRTALFLDLKQQHDLKLNLLKILSHNKNFSAIFSSFSWFIIAPDSKNFIVDIKKRFTHLNITIAADITVGIAPKGRR